MLSYLDFSNKSNESYGHTGTIFCFSTDMLLLDEKGATIIMSVNRLDEDDKSVRLSCLALRKEIISELHYW